MMTGGCEPFNGLIHRRACRSVIDHAMARRRVRIPADRLRHQLFGRAEFAQKPLHIVDIGAAILGVAGIAVARRAAGEEGAAGWVRAGIGPVRDTVAIGVEITAKILAGLKLRRSHHLAAVIAPAAVPGERTAETLV